VHRRADRRDCTAGLLIGGAAINRAFGVARRSCRRRIYEPPRLYCKDVFEGPRRWTCSPTRLAATVEQVRTEIAAERYRVETPVAP
jgi:hypothetical protein